MNSIVIKTFFNSGKTIGLLCLLLLLFAVYCIQISKKKSGYTNIESIHISLNLSFLEIMCCYKTQFHNSRKRHKSNKKFQRSTWFVLSDKPNYPFVLNLKHSIYLFYFCCSIVRQSKYSKIHFNGGAMAQQFVIQKADSPGSRPQCHMTSELPLLFPAPAHLAFRKYVDK